MKHIFKLNSTGGLQLFQILRFGQLFVAGILLARSPAGFEAISAYETLLLLSGLLSFFWVNGLIQSMLANSDEEDSDVHPRTFIYALLLSLIGAIIFLIAKTPIQSILGRTDDIPHYLLFAVYIAINGSGLLTEYVYLRKQNPVGMVSYAIIVFGVQLILLFSAAFWGNGSEDIIMAMVAGAAIRFIWAAVVSFNDGFNPSKLYSKQQIGLTISLALVALIGGSAEYIDGILIRSWFGADNFVFFRYGARELPFTLLMANALSSSFILMSSKGGDINEIFTEIKNRSLRLMHWLFPISIILLFISPLIYKLVFGPLFIESANIFNIYLLLICSRLVFPQSILTGMKKGRIQMLISVIELIINIIISILLLPYWGMAGVAFGTVIAYMIEKVLLILYLNHKHGIRVNSYVPLKEWGIYSSILIGCYFILYF